MEINNNSNVDQSVSFSSSADRPIPNLSASNDFLGVEVPLTQTSGQIHTVIDLTHVSVFSETTSSLQDKKSGADEHQEIVEIFGLVPQPITKSISNPFEATDFTHFEEFMREYEGLEPAQNTPRISIADVQEYRLKTFQNILSNNPHSSKGHIVKLFAEELGIAFSTANVVLHKWRINEAKSDPTIRAAFENYNNR